MLKIKRLPLGFLSENCYLVFDSESGGGYVVDPGGQPESIIKAIESEKMIPKCILLTHAHVDHIGAIPELAEKYGIGVWLHKDEYGLYLSPENSLGPWMEAVRNLPEPMAEIPPVEGVNFKVIHTPGHTRGGVCYYFEKEKIILTGDTLFKGTYGRTDFPGGNEAEIFRSIKGKLLTLPEDVVVYPGHEASTTIGAENRNPIFR